MNNCCECVTIKVPKDWYACMTPEQRDAWLYKMVEELAKRGEGAVPDITANATVNNTTGTPTVNVVKTGDDYEPVFTFNFDGLKGERGVQGIQGEKGDTGIGEKGDTGETGPAGRAATVTIGSVTNGETASVTNTGTDTDAVFNFVLPRGLQGEQGEKGDNGGTVTVTAGASVTNTTGTPTVDVFTQEVTPTLTNILFNFSGIKGETGSAGPAGPRGEKGDKGDTGPAGATGLTGPIGPQGPRGLNGADGEDGPQGPEGPIGPTGLTGPAGPAGPKGEPGIQGPAGPAGESGNAATITIGEVTDGDEPAVTNSGTETDAILNFTFPRGAEGLTGPAGETGPEGRAATIEIGTVESGEDVSVTNSGDATDAIFDFVLPKGDAATIAVGTVTTGEEASVTNSGTESAAIFDFVLPTKGVKGDPGQSATITIGDVEEGETASVTNGGTDTDAIFDFVLPKGPAGDAGRAATVSVGTVTTAETPTVTNVGTNTDAIFNFALPGNGPAGPAGEAATIEVGSVTTGDTASVTNVGTENAAIFDFVIPTGGTKLHKAVLSLNTNSFTADVLYLDGTRSSVSMKRGALTYCRGIVSDDGYYVFPSFNLSLSISGESVNALGVATLYNVTLEEGVATADIIITGLTPISGLFSKQILSIMADFVNFSYIKGEF